jgi:hypothetical protein
LRSTPRRHDLQNPRRVSISGQARRIFGIIQCELRPPPAIKAIIDQTKTEGHLGRATSKAVPETNVANGS